MSKLIETNALGVLRSGFCAFVDDYAIAGGWGLRDKLFIVGDASGALHAFDGTSGKVIWKNSEAHIGGVMGVALSTDGTRLATIGQDGQLAFWNISNGKLYNRFAVANGWVEHVTWSESGKYLATASGRTVTVLSPEGERLWSSDEHPSTISALNWVGDRELVTACYGCVTFFDLFKNEISERYQWKGSLISLALSPDGNIVACGSQDKSVHFWRRLSGEDSRMSGYQSKVSVLTFSGDGLLLATSGGSDIKVWSFDGEGPEGTRPGILDVHVAPIRTLAFSHRQRRLASGGYDSGVVVWELEKSGEGRVVGTAFASAAIEKIYWRPDDRGLVAIDAEGGITAWRTG